LSKTNAELLAEQFENYDIPKSVEQLPEKQYRQFQTLAGKLLTILGEKST